MSTTGRSQAGYLVELFLDGLLLLGFAVQAFLLGCLLAYGYVPLPAHWISEKISHHLPPGLSIRAESYALTLDGSIRVENLTVHLDGIEEACFKAKHAHAAFDIQWSRQAPFILKECILLEGGLMLPAVYSPDGNRRGILDRVALRLLPGEHQFTIDSFAARHEDIRLRGRMQWPTTERASVPFDAREQADRFFQQVAYALKQKEPFDRFEEPTVVFQIDAARDGAVYILSKISSRNYQHPQVQATNLTLDAGLSLTEQLRVSQSSIWLKADEVTIPAYDIRAAAISAKLAPGRWEALLQGEWPDIELLAGTLDIKDIQLETPRLNLRPQGLPKIAFDGLTSGLHGAIEFSGYVNAQTRAAEIAAAGSLDLLSIVPAEIASKLPPIAIHQPPYYNLSLTFNDGLELMHGQLSAQIGAFQVDGIDFNNIHLGANYHHGVFSIDRSYFSRDWQWLELGFGLDRATNDYTLTLKGSAKPDDYNALLPDWWEAIFRDFDFENIEDGLGDFVIYGNTGDGVAGFFFGHAAARNVSYQGVPLDAGELFVRGFGPYAEIHRLDARSGEGFVRGDIGFASRVDDVRGPMSVRLDLETQLRISDAAKLFDENIAEILADFETDALPHILLRGAIFNQAYPEFEGLSHIHLNATCPSALTYKGLPLDSLRFDLFGRQDITYLRDMKIGYAGGLARADADILTDGSSPAQVRFQAELEGADQARATSQLASLTDPQKELKSNREAPGEGRLDLQIHARTPVQDFLQISGYGSFQIKNETLYAFQLFGPLSKLLEDLRLGLTSFSLNQMHADFKLEDGLVRFKDLEINGPRTRIEALGSMRLENHALAMRVSVFPFGNTGDPDSHIRRLKETLMRPIPNILEFELTGTPEEQQWRSLYDPRNLIPGGDPRNLIPYDPRRLIPQR